MRRRTAVLTLVLAALLGLWLGGSLRHLAAARGRALAASEDLAECRRLADRIRLLRDRSRLAEDRERVPEQTTGRIEAAAKSAGISAARLVRISPEPARRVGETAYKEKPTRVLLRKVTLKQLVAMVHGLTRGEGMLRAKSLRLTAPSRNATDDLWDAELVLVYLIYEPPPTL